MQLQKFQIKPSFLLDGIASAKQGNVLNYKPEKDVHLEQYFYNQNMHQMMSKLKQDRKSQHNLHHSLSKSLDQTLNQSKDNLKSRIQKSSSPLYQSFINATNKTQMSEISRSLSKEHLVTFLDSLITTVQNVQQLVITYFPKEQIDEAIIQQQNELAKINHVTQLLTSQLRTNSITHKKQVENIKTQKNFSKLPQIQKVEISLNQKTERGREQYIKYHNTSRNNTIIINQRTLSKNIKKNHYQYQNNSFKPYESKPDAIAKNLLQMQQIKSQQQNKIIQLPQLSVSKQQQKCSLKKYYKDIQQVLKKPKQQGNENVNNWQSPIHLQSKSVGVKDILPSKHQQNSIKFDYKQISSQKIEKQKSRLQNNSKSNKKQDNIHIQINIIDVDAQTDKKEDQDELNVTTVPVEIVEEINSNLKNQSGISQIQVEQEYNNNEQDKITLQETAILQMKEQDKYIETFEKLDEKNKFIQESQQSLKEKQDDNYIINIIQEQVKQNDEKLQKIQQKEQSISLLENDNQNNFIKVIEAKSGNENIINPLEDIQDHKNDQQINSLFVTLEPSEQNYYQQPYQNEGFEQDS